MMSDRDLESENRELTESIFNTYEAIESVIAMTDFHEDIGGIDPHKKIFEQSGERLKELFPFTTLAFYLVDEESGALKLSYCRPAKERSRIEGLIAAETAAGNLHIALRDQRPMLRPTPEDRTERLFLHSICTPRRCRGLFAGLYRSGQQQSDRLSQLLVSLVLSHSAKALESVDLYALFERANRLAADAADGHQQRAVQADREILKLIELLSTVADAADDQQPLPSRERLDLLYRLYAAANMQDRSLNLQTILDSIEGASEKIDCEEEIKQKPIAIERALGIALVLHELNARFLDNARLHIEEYRMILGLRLLGVEDSRLSPILRELVEKELSGRFGSEPEKLLIEIPLSDEPTL